MRLRFATTTATATSQGGHEPPSRRVATPGRTRAAPGLTGSAPAQAKIIDRNIHWLETSMRSGWTLRPEVLRRHLEGSAEGEDISRILVLNSPSNPTGRAHTRDEVKVRMGKRRGEGAPYTQLPPDSAPCAQLLAEVCRKHGVIVLSDEIYGETHMDGGHVSIAEYYPEGTIVSHGISKGFGAGGWRLGAHVFPPQLRRLLDAMAVVASETYTSVSAPIQHAACAAYEYPDSVAAYVRDSRRVLKVCPPPVGPLRRRAAGPTPQAPRLWASGAHTRCGRRVWTCWTRWAASTASPPGTATATRWPPAASTLARSWWRRAFETRVRCCRWRGGPTASPRPRAHSSTSPPPPQASRFCRAPTLAAPPPSSPRGWRSWTSAASSRCGAPPPFLCASPACPFAPLPLPALTRGAPLGQEGAEGVPAESEEWLRGHCPRVVSGIERLCQWTKEL